MQDSRYSCQVALADFGNIAQENLAQAKVLVVGMGGLGCPASQYLVAAGVGTVGLVDFDQVSISNLHRQILYGDKDVGKLKVNVAKNKLKSQNPSTILRTYNQKITKQEDLENIIEDYDIILDCLDNFETRYILNDSCVLAGKPLVYGSIYQYEGQVAVWNHGPGSVNYRDVFPKASSNNIPNCSDGGVIPTIAGIVGCLQANEAIKYLADLDGLLKNQLLIFDVRTLSSFTIDLAGSIDKDIAQTEDLSQQSEVKIEQISISELNKMLKDDCVLIDVRTPDEHKDKNIGGINIPLNAIDKSILELISDKDVVFYCASGARSRVATKIVSKLRSHGRTMSLVGGIDSI